MTRALFCIYNGYIMVIIFSTPWPSSQFYAKKFARKWKMKIRETQFKKKKCFEKAVQKDSVKREAL